MLTLSVMPVAIPEAKSKKTAEKALEFRREAEAQVDPIRKVTFGDQWVTPKPDEHLVEMGYAGHDDRGYIFRFLGFVTTRRIVNFQCETKTQDDEQAKRVFDNCFRGVKLTPSVGTGR
jgi:hypothetical protein